jgi:hypothetical protein
MLDRLGPGLVASFPPDTRYVEKATVENIAIFGFLESSRVRCTTIGTVDWI